ncbi:ABC transporter ATP-binding protein [Corynebacterium hindlerae]|uniref:ABC transporter ATP-binding protein n=1 Tax=Corynebacterium hindlerae TaxID=699041 RepID=A0A7G5FDY7_9CORY|nr:ABC transporter ATP-binding protein [Corynebacterium hindlerae]QMV84828.1 ABC transporter ATP-binding protein [Corynebacterium hindlerae]
MPTTLTARALSAGYGADPIVKDLTISFEPGKITSIVGPNGCGKSTFLRTLARLIRPTAGVIELDGKALNSYSSRELARRLGLLPQSPIAPEGMTVADLVGRGRTPYQGILGRWSATDYEIVAEAMAATEVDELATRCLEDLSGGQRQRAWIAMALAQQTDVLLLDEPTTYLDLKHQLEVLDLLTDLNRRHGTTIIMVLHDLNLAARYSDNLVAMRDGHLHAVGAPSDVLTQRLTREAFDLETLIVTDPVSGLPSVSPIGRHHTTYAKELS